MNAFSFMSRWAVTRQMPSSPFAVRTQSKVRVRKSKGMQEEQALHKASCSFPVQVSDQQCHGQPPAQVSLTAACKRQPWAPPLLLMISAYLQQPNILQFVLFHSDLNCCPLTKVITISLLRRWEHRRALHRALATLSAFALFPKEAAPSLGSLVVHMKLCVGDMVVTGYRQHSSNGKPLNCLSGRAHLVTYTSSTCLHRSIIYTATLV